MLHFIETGEGPAVVLLHAFPMDSALWAAQRRPLAQAGFRVITPDLPGFGGSPVADAEPSMDVMADAVADLLDHLAVPTAVVGGLSMGGYVTMAMIRRHRARMIGAILADTKGAADPPEAAATRASVAARVEAAGSTVGIADEMLPKLLGATTHRDRPEVVDRVRRWIGAQPAAGVAWAQRAMAARPDSLADIGSFGRPVLVLYGDQDAISPSADAQAMASAARGGGSPTTVVEVPDAGHLTAVEQPDAVTHALLGWLQANATG